MKFFDDLFESKDKNKKQEESSIFSIMTEIANDSDYSEQELDQMGLEDWQKDLVRSGEYEPYDFEEDSEDEDSYYNEADD